MAQPHGLFEVVRNQTANAATAEFRIKQREQLLLGLLGLGATIAWAGDFDGGQASLQFFLAGRWLDSGVVLSAATDSVTIDRNAAPTGTKYRFLFSGGGGSMSVSIEIAAPFELEFN